MPRYSIKPGRGPSSFNAVGSVFAAIFGVLWTLGAIATASSAPFPFGIVFPLFGVVFVALAIAGAVYHAHNASQPNRFSEYDVISTEDEPEPLFRSPEPTDREGRAGMYCTHCGAAMRENDKFCSACGCAASVGSSDTTSSR